MVLSFFFLLYTNQLHEGPLWDESSNSLLFVDVMGNKIYKWNESDGVSEFISPSGNTGYAPNIDFGLLGANGLVFNNEGDIIVCQHGDRRIASIDNTASSSPNFVTRSFFKRISTNN